MRIDDWRMEQAWAEPEDVQVAEAPPPAPAPPAPAPAAPPEPPPLPFWAEGTPVPQSLLERLPAAQLQAPPEATASIAAAPTTALAAAPAAPSGYVGEPPADATWLAQREAAFGAIRSDYEAARSFAQSQPQIAGTPGWVATQPSTDESGQLPQQQAGSLVFIPSADTTPVITGYDESGPIYSQPAGQWLAFDEAAFAQSYQAQGGAPLQSLARLYDSSPAALLGQHPELWSIATTDHAVNAGPPPAGRAMGDATQLGMVDLYMADPQVAKLIDAFGGSAAPATGGIAKEQARLYGEARYEQLSRLGNAMQSVRDQYSSAMANAAAGGSTAGWVEREVTTTTYDESGGQQTTSLQRSFDPDAFTAWYTAQDGLANQAFRDFYGQSHTTSNGTNESGESFGSTTTFDNPNWTMSSLGGGMSHNELVRIDPNAPPRLNNDSAVGFDLEAGWATHQSNIHQKTDWLDQLVQVAIVVGVGYLTAGTLGPAVAGSMGLTAGGTAALAVSAGVVGAATSLTSGLLSGNLSLQSVLKGALGGALTAGITSSLGSTLTNLGTAGQIAATATIQGGVQALLGGSFKDGALAGLASGLASAASGSLDAKIAEAALNGSMTTAEVFAAKTFSKVLGSAIRAAGSPGDPGQAFASAFLTEVVGRPGDTAGGAAPGSTGASMPPAFDDEGNLMPGVIDPTLSPAQQAAQLVGILQAQGLSTAEAVDLALDAIPFGANVTLQAPNPAAASWSDAELQARVDDVERLVQQDLVAQEARDASLLGPEDLQELTGGAGSARTPIQPVLNGRFDTALNAAADVLGLTQPMAELRTAVGQLQNAQAENRVETMRQALRDAGVKNVPSGYEYSVDANGTVRDYGRTIDKLQGAYQDFLTDKRYTESWGTDWRNLRIGRSGMTVAEFEARTLRVQQQAVNDAYRDGMALIASGALKLKNNDHALTLGAFVDERQRLRLRQLGQAEGLPDSSASNLFAANRWLRGAGMNGVPDLRLGANTISDASLAWKDGLTEQLRRWNTIRANDTLIIRPDALGGAYVVPRTTIRPIVQPGRGG